MKRIKHCAKQHRQNERAHVRSARHFIAAGDYGQAIRYLGWAMQQQGAADAYADASGFIDARDAMAKAKPVTPRDPNRSTKR